MTIIGSVLGAIAFFQNLAKDLVSTNKEKWQKITEIISPVEMDNLQYNISSRRIPGKIIDKLQHLIYEIDKKNLDIVGFKSIFKNKIQKKLKRLKDLYENFREYVQVPYWCPFEDKSQDVKTFGYEFDKDYFFEGQNKDWTQIDFDNATTTYANHLEKAGLIAIEMENTFLAIQKLASKESFELILPWKWFS